MVLIGEEQSFTLTANVESPGYIRIAPKGYVVSRRSNGVYVAPLIPGLFTGVGGTQLTTWRQWVPSAGSQVILSKPAGDLLVPKEELYWRKISNEEREVLEIAAEPAKLSPLINLIWIIPVFALFGYISYKGIRGEI